MNKKLAILQMADTPQVESTAVMLKHAGYKVKVCSNELRTELVRVGCDTVLAVRQMLALGYDALDSTIEEASVEDMNKCDLFVEIKVRNVPKIVKRWPHLENKIVYWRVNGAQPEICPKGGDEVNLPCPIISACLWYGTPQYYQTREEKPTVPTTDIAYTENYLSVSLEEQQALCKSIKMTNGMCYSFWPPYPRHEEYDRLQRGPEVVHNDPFCLCYRVKAWGYGDIVDQVTSTLAVNCFGQWSPAGQVSHSSVPDIVVEGKALVHLKTVDCPGWALYEAMLGGCPVITGRVLNSRMLAYDLLKHDETCLEFGAPTSSEYGRGPIDMEQCYTNIEAALEQLSDPDENRRIGEAGRQRLNELMWQPERDGDSFLDFMERWFP